MIDIVHAMDSEDTIIASLKEFRKKLQIAATDSVVQKRAKEKAEVSMNKFLEFIYE